METNNKNNNDGISNSHNNSGAGIVSSQMSSKGQGPESIWNLPPSTPGSSQLPTEIAPHSVYADVNSSISAEHAKADLASQIEIVSPLRSHERPPVSDDHSPSVRSSTSPRSLMSRSNRTSQAHMPSLTHDVKSKWGVISTTPTTSGSGGGREFLGTITTIDAHSNRSNYALQKHEHLFRAVGPNTSQPFDGDPATGQQGLAIRKRKYGEFQQDMLVRNIGVDHLARSSQVLNSPMSTGLQGRQVGQNHIDNLLMASGSSVMDTSEDPRPLQTAPTSVEVSRQDSIILNPIHNTSQATSSTGFIRSLEDKMRSEDSEMLSLTTSDEMIREFQRWTNDRDKRSTIQVADEEVILEMLSTYDTSSSVISLYQPEKPNSVFSYLHEEVWFGESLSQEEMEAQKDAFNNKGKCTRSIHTNYNLREESVHPMNTKLPIPKCQRHASGKDSKEEYECDSDCFDEYDPLEDVSELRSALERLKNTSEDGRKSKDRGKSQDEISSSSSRKGQSRTLRKLSRRPYLSYEARTLLADLPPEKMSDMGSQIHISFSKEEATRVWLHVYINLSGAGTIAERFSMEAALRTFQEFLSSSKHSKVEKHMLLHSVIQEASANVPGRKPEEISFYLSDVFRSLTDPISFTDEIIIENQMRRKEPSWHSLILSRQLSDVGLDTLSPVGRGESWSSSYNRESLRFLKPFKTFAEGSSDVVDCTWDEDGQNFALACTTYNDMYNRPGNLMLGSPEGTIKFLCGHQTLRPSNQGNEAILDTFLHSTVSSVDFSGSCLYSSSFDKTIKIWDTKSRLLRRTLLFPAPVLRMKMHGKVENMGAGCLQNGQVVIFRASLGESGHESLDSLQVFDAIQDYIEPSSVLWTTAKGRNNWLFVGYDSKEADKRHFNSQAGDLRIYDATRGVEIGGVKPGSTRQFDTCLDQTEQLLVAGAMANIANRPSPNTHSQVRVWDLRIPLHKTFELGCVHKDINKVTISPSGTYITSSGTNGKSYLWDVRRSADPLHTLPHGDSKTPLSAERDREEIDTGVTFASWAVNSSVLVTGSSDGIVKVWDPAMAEPLLYDLATFDDPVMSGSFSPDGDALIIGDTTGKATLLSYMGRHGPPVPFVQDRSMLAPTASEAEEEISGVASAKELLRTGQVVLVSEDGGQPSVYGR